MGQVRSGCVQAVREGTTDGPVLRLFPAREHKDLQAVFSEALVVEYEILSWHAGEATLMLLVNGQVAFHSTQVPSPLGHFCPLPWCDPRALSFHVSLLASVCRAHAAILTHCKTFMCVRAHICSPSPQVKSQCHLALGPQLFTVEEQIGHPSLAQIHSLFMPCSCMPRLAFRSPRPVSSFR